MTHSPLLRLGVRKGQSWGLFCSGFLFPSFRDLRILFLPSLEVKPRISLKVTHTHTHTHTHTRTNTQHHCLSRSSMEGAPERFKILYSSPRLCSAPSQLRINAWKLSGDQDTRRKPMFFGRLQGSGGLSLLDWAFPPSSQTSDAWRGLALPSCPEEVVGTSTGGLYSVTAKGAH